MSESVIRSGDFATSRRGGVDLYEMEFTRTKSRDGVSLQNISRMLGRPEADLAPYTERQIRVAPKVLTLAPLPRPPHPSDVAIALIAKSHALEWGVPLDVVRSNSLKHRAAFPRSAAISDLLDSGFEAWRVAAYFRISKQAVYSAGKRHKRRVLLGTQPSPETLARLAPTPPTSSRTSMQDVLERVAERRGVTVAHIKSQDRHKPIGLIRQEFMWECAQIVSEDGSRCYSNGLIGRAAGGRDSSTVHHGIKAHQARLDALQNTQEAA